MEVSDMNQFVRPAPRHPQLAGGVSTVELDAAAEYQADHI